MIFETIVKDLMQNQRRYSKTAIIRGLDGVYNVHGSKKDNGKYTAMISPYSLDGNTLSLWLFDTETDINLANAMKKNSYKRFLRKHKIPYELIEEGDTEIGIAFDKKYFLKMCQLAKIPGRKGLGNVANLKPPLNSKKTPVKRGSRGPFSGDNRK